MIYDTFFYFQIFQILVSVSDDSSIRLWGPASQYRQGPILPPPGNPPRQQSLNNGAV